MKPLLLCLALLTATSTSQAFTISLSSSDVGVVPAFSDVTQFSISIDVEAPLSPGVYNNPTLNRVVYRVVGLLAAGTPSSFRGFGLNRDIGGAEFYAQGSSLSFEIINTANLLDGLQLSELAGPDPSFLFNAREVGTGRYHPMLFQLHADGTGSVRNSNNFGGINPATKRMVDVDFGEEYVSNLTFDPGALTLASPIPEPSSALMLALGMLTLIRRRNG